MWWVALAGGIALAALVGTVPGGEPSAAEAAEGDHPIYGDALASGWRNWSWKSTVNLAAAPGYNGSARAISWRADAGYGGLNLHADSGVPTNSATRLRFAVRASQADQRFRVGLRDASNALLGNRPLAEVGGDPAAGAWKLYDVPLTALNAAGKTITAFQLQDAEGIAQPAVLVDQVELVDAGPNCLGAPAYPEIRPENRTANNTPGEYLDDAYFRGSVTWRPYWDRVNGRGCLGTTGQILGWAARKWRFHELGYPDLAKAQAWQESSWYQGGVGDNGLSFGITQIKKTTYPGTYPLSQRSTAFAADYTMAFVRAAYDGQLGYHTFQTKGNIRAAVGLWFDGGCPTCPGAVDYANKVFSRYAARPWGQGG